MYRFSIRHRFRAITLALVAMILSQGASAEVPPPSGILWIDWAAEDMAFALKEAAPADSAAPPKRPAATHSIESIEINRLRDEIRLMRDLIEQEVIGRVISLENEVRTLRGALQDQQIADYANGTIVPQPGMRAPASSPAPMPTASEIPPDPFQFTVVDEWGRSPEVVAELGSNASTLIGLAGVVPPRSAKADVVALLQQLHTEYAAYDNINIELFDTAAAAQEFATQQTIDSAHHIASISRHRATNRDLILYLGDGVAEPVASVGE